ncbi:alkaline phosphatase [Vibrio ponticus]|uniref:Alkaline phosphatase n=1 Tax=Vibrio ponticus TaxID=265668 RepID=A0ABX3FBQ1_9VIBR|nr:choice-of-anchor I family protein [Vibrio ponticus]OLQ88794.1 alkaline phosphatase [Vibrio ponticus]
MTTPLKTISVLTLSILAAACANTKTTTSNDLAIQCINTKSTKSAQDTDQKENEATNGKVKGLTFVGTSASNAPFDSSAAEIVNYDSCTDKLYVVNANAKRVDVMSLDSESKPTRTSYIDLFTAGITAEINIGAANSVAVHNGLVAVAIESENKQEDGIIALYRSDDLSLITTYPAGALPDMVSFSKDGRYIAAANEGEPNADYSVDPEGSVTLVDLKKGPMDAKVSQVSFSDLKSVDENVRISGKNASIAQDLEPEYLTFAGNGKLYVALQENNAFAIIDPKKAKLEKVVGLGSKSWSESKLDASNKDGILGNLQSYPNLVGLYMPDSIDSYSVKGKTYIISANEGDGREYGVETTQKVCDELGFTWDGDDYKRTRNYAKKEDFCISHIDEVRGKDLQVAANHPLFLALKDNDQLARLKVVKPSGILSAEDNVEAFGSRSFSIWDDKGELVFDSGDQFARAIRTRNKQNFNSSNDSNDSADDRSDDKGGEPEAIEVATINDRHYAFIGLERQGGILVYDITDPEKAQVISFTNRRDFSQSVCTQMKDGECANGRYNPAAGDLGPESINYFSRNGDHFIAVGNEVSGTTSVFKIRL